MTPPHDGHFIPKRPRFFQIIVHGTQNKKLWIPQRFMRNYGHEMSKYVQVKDPSGREWKLECSECDGGTWFINGWQEFFYFYCLEHGHLVVFEYEGNSKFSVSIFDKTATEIMYPVNGTQDFGDNVDEKIQEINEKETDLDELVIEISDDSSSSPIRRKLSHSPRAHKMMRNNSRTEAEKSSCEGVATLGKTRQLLEDRKAKAYERAKAFESENPFVLMVVRPSFIHPKKGQLCLPVSFSNDHFNQSEGTAILYSEGRRWDVGFRMSKHTLTRSRSRVSLGIGWRKFHSESHLKVDDVCVLELSNKVDITFKVHIYRVHE